MTGIPTVVPTLSGHIVLDSACRHFDCYVLAEVQQGPGAGGYLANREVYRVVAIVERCGAPPAAEDVKSTLAESDSVRSRRKSMGTLELRISLNTGR